MPSWLFEITFKTDTRKLYKLNTFDFNTQGFAVINKNSDIYFQISRLNIENSWTSGVKPECFVDYKKYIFYPKIYRFLLVNLDGKIPLKVFEFVKHSPKVDLNSIIYISCQCLANPIIHLADANHSFRTNPQFGNDTYGRDNLYKVQA